MNEVLQTNNLSPEELIEALKSIRNFKNFYTFKVRHYTLERHTMLVLAQYSKYFYNVHLPISENLFKFMLGVHDIGKPTAFIEGDKDRQYLYSAFLINDARELLPFTDIEIDLCLTLISADPIGMYMQNQVDLQSTVNKIRKLIEQTDLDKKDFFRLISIYYQCDIGSYTVDAGGLAFLEHLFEYKNNMKVFNNENMRLNFSPLYEIKYLELEKTFLNG